MKQNVKNRRNGTSRVEAERVLLAVSLALVILLGGGLIGLTCRYGQERQMRQMLTEAAFLSVLQQMAADWTGSDEAAKALACEKGMALLEELPDGLHREEWQTLLHELRLGDGEGAGAELLGATAGAADEALQNGRDTESALQAADVALCRGLHDRQLFEKTARRVFRLAPPIVGVRSRRKHLSVQAVDYLGTADGMQEAMQAVDGSLHILYCQNAFVVFRDSGDGYLQLVMCKDGEGDPPGETLDAESVCKRYHLCFRELLETGHYAAGSVRGKLYTDRCGLALHLAADRRTGKLSVVDVRR